MSTKLKWAFILSACLLGAGLLICAAGMTALSWDFLKLDVSEGELKTGTFSALEVSELNIDLSATSLAVTPSADGQIHVQAYADEDETFQMGTEGGTLYITEQLTYQHFFPLQMFRGLKSSAYEMRLELPENFDGTVQIQNESGWMEMEGIAVSGDIACDFDNGSVALRNVSARDLMLDSDNGDISISRTNAHGSVKAKSANGFLRLEDTGSAGNVNLDNQNGDVACKNIQAETLSVSGENGKILLEDSAVSRVTAENQNGSVIFSRFAAPLIEAKTQNGSIRGQIKGKESDYRIITVTGNGSSNLKNNAEAGRPNYLQAETENGSIAVEFVDE